MNLCFYFPNCLTVDTRAAEERKSNGEKERVKELVDWPEDGDVFHEHCVPEEADNEHVNEEYKEENDEPLEKPCEAGNVNKVTNHL